MGEIVKHHGDTSAALNDKNFTKQRTSLNLDAIRKEITDDGEGSVVYKLKK